MSRLSGEMYVTGGSYGMIFCAQRQAARLRMSEKNLANIHIPQEASVAIQQIVFYGGVYIIKVFFVFQRIEFFVQVIDKTDEALLTVFLFPKGIAELFHRTGAAIGTYH